MPQIYAIGETIYDIIFRDNQPVAAKAGGAMLNTAVSLGRLGLPICFISEYANDHAGDIIDAFLINNGVDTSFNYRYSEGKTTIALAFLNDQNDARYSFYKLFPEKRLEINLPDFKPGDIVLFGAFFSLMPEIREQLLAFVKAARNAGAFLVYDPNIRSPHKDEIGSLREMIYENFMLADIVRASDEDFLTMFDASSGTKAYNILKERGCDLLVYTKSNVGVEVYTTDGMTELEVDEVKTVSTIGAGDSFNAGLIFELYRSGVNINSDHLKKYTKTAIRFGSHVCTHYENYISESFADEVRSVT